MVSDADNYGDFDFRVESTPIFAKTIEFSIFTEIASIPEHGQ